MIISGSNWVLQLATLSFVTNPQQKVFAPRAQQTPGIAQESVSPYLANVTHRDTKPTRPVTWKPSQDPSTPVPEDGSTIKPHVRCKHLKLP